MRKDGSPTEELTVWMLRVLKQGQAIFCEELYVFCKTTPSVLPGPVPRAASDHMVTFTLSKQGYYVPTESSVWVAQKHSIARWKGYAQH